MGNLCSGQTHLRPSVVGVTDESTDVVARLDAMTVDELAKIPRFSFNGQRVTARVSRVYDGDTVFVVFPHADYLYSFVVRMKGYDSAEMRVSKSNPHRDVIKAKAVSAKMALSELVLGKKVILVCHEHDKYGRLLADVYTMDGLHVNKYMIDEKHGIPYDPAVGAKRSHVVIDTDTFDL